MGICLLCVYSLRAWSCIDIFRIEWLSRRWQGNREDSSREFWFAELCYWPLRTYYSAVGISTAVVPSQRNHLWQRNRMERLGGLLILPTRYLDGSLYRTPVVVVIRGMVLYPHRGHFCLCMLSQQKVKSNWINRTGDMLSRVYQASYTLSSDLASGCCGLCYHA